MKKVLLITRPIAPPWDEASKNFAFALARNISGVQVGLLTNGIVEDLPSNVRQHSIYTSNSFGYLQKIRLAKNLRKIRKGYEILHYLFTPTKANSFFIKHFLNGNNAKSIQTVATLREDLYCEAEIKNLIFADLIITYSDHAKDKLNSFGFKNVQRIYPGIDLDEYKLKEKNPEYLKKYNLSRSDFIINFSGEYSRLNAIDTVISSFIEVRNKIPAKLSLAVRIKNEKDAQKKEEVAARLKRHNLLEHVAFHDDANYKLSEIYNLCDVSIFPIQTMAGKFDIPLAVIEAMACEKPLILTNIDRLRELSVGQNSVIIEPDNVKQLSESILDLYKHPEKRIEIGKNARKFVEERFDIKQIARQYEQIYENL